MAEPVAYTYRAFISYSHADTASAKWLHRALETFRIDKDFAGRETTTGTVPKTLRPIFRDREDFTAGHSLTDQTLAALDASAALIVVCSPAAAQSPYVTEEIRLFKSRHPDRPVIPLIVDGKPDDPRRECFPRSLKFKLTSKGQIGRRKVELLAADAREHGDDKDLALAKVVAGLLGVSSDDIFRRAERERRRKGRVRSGVVAVLALLAIAATGSAAYAWHQLKTNEAFLSATLKTATEIVDEAVSQAERFGVPRNATLAMLNKAEGLFDNMAQLGRVTPELRHQKALMLIQFARNYELLGDTQKQKARAREAFDIAAKLAAETPGDRDNTALRAQASLEVGKVLDAQGSLADAVRYYLDAYEAFDRLARAHPERKVFWNNAAISTDRIGDAILAQGHLSLALKYYQSGLKIRQALVKDEPKDVDLQSSLAISYDRQGAIFLDQDKPAKALESHGKSLAIIERIATGTPRDTKRQYDLATCFERMADALKAQDRFDEALDYARRAHDIRDRLVKTDPGNARWQNGLSISYEKVAGLLREQGKPGEAMKLYRHSLEIRSQLWGSDPTNTVWLHDLAIAHRLVGDMLKEQDQFAAAAEAFEKNIEANAALVDMAPRSADAKHNLSTGYQRLGSLLKEEGKSDEALAAFRKSLTIRQKLAGVDPTDLKRQRNLLLAYRRVAETLKELGDLPGAMEDFQKRLAIAALLSEAEPDHLGYRADLAFAYVSVGEVHQAQDNLPAALEGFRNNLTQREVLVAARPGDNDDQRNLSIAHGRIAKVLQAMGDLDGALAAHEKGHAVAEQLAKAEPEDRALQRDLYVSNDKIARILRQQHRFDAANTIFRQNLERTRAIAARHAGNEQAQQDFGNAVGAFGGTAYHAVLAHDFEEALKIADEAIAAAPDKIWFNSNRAHALMFLGRDGEARAVYQKYQNIPKAQGDRSWNEIVLTDFAEIRETGIDHPLMAEIEAAFRTRSHAAPKSTDVPATTETVQ